MYVVLIPSMEIT